MQMNDQTAPSRADRSEAASRDARLIAYSLAAGVSTIVAGAAAADASVVYSTAQNMQITSGNSFSLDLDNNGFGDLKLKNYVFGGGSYQGATVNFAPGLLASFSANGFAYVSALGEGASIGPATVGPNFFGSMAYGAANPNAQFNDVTGAFIGLSFPAGAITRYGWVRVDVKNSAKFFNIVDWAYETDANVPIAAGATVSSPEPTSLSFLAAGSAGLALLRRRSRA